MSREIADAIRKELHEANSIPDHEWRLVHIAAVNLRFQVEIFLSLRNDLLNRESNWDDVISLQKLNDAIDELLATSKKSEASVIYKIFDVKEPQ